MDSTRKLLDPIMEFYDSIRISPALFIAGLFIAAQVVAQAPEPPADQPQWILPASAAFVAAFTVVIWMLLVSMALDIAALIGGSPRRAWAARHKRRTQLSRKVREL